MKNYKNGRNKHQKLNQKQMMKKAKRKEKKRDNAFKNWTKIKKNKNTSTKL